MIQSVCSESRRGCSYSSSLDCCPGDHTCTLHASYGRWRTCGFWGHREDHLLDACHQPGNSLSNGSNLSTHHRSVKLIGGDLLLLGMYFVRSDVAYFSFRSPPWGHY